MCFSAHWSHKTMWRGVKRGSYRISRTEVTVSRMQYLVVFNTWGSLEVVKMSLLVYPGFPRNLRSVFLKSLAVTVLEAPLKYRFFLGKESFRNRLTLFTWRPNFARTWREMSLALSRIYRKILLLSVCLWYSKKISPFFNKETISTQPHSLHTRRKM